MATSYENSVRAVCKIIGEKGPLYNSAPSVIAQAPPCIHRISVRHDEEMHVDHLSYAAGPEGLAACVQRIGARLGAAFVDGGLHPAFGTRNFVLPLRNGCYLEVVGVLDHPAVDLMPFGQAVKARGAAGGGWLGWAVRVEDIATIETRLGRRAIDSHRRRPDGFELRWKQIGMQDLAVDPQRPFFVEWETDETDHPSANGSAVALTGMELAGDESAVDAYLSVASMKPLDGIELSWEPAYDDEETGLVAALFTTPGGVVRVE
jgi:hypothetical protein